MTLARTREGSNPPGGPAQTNDAAQLYDSTSRRSGGRSTEAPLFWNLQR